MHSITHTLIVWLIAWRGCTKKQGLTFRHKKQRGNIVPVVKLRNAKVILSSRRYPWKKPVAFVRLGIASAGSSFPRESMERRIGGVEGVLCCCCGASVSVDALVVCRGQLEKRSCWYVSDKYCVASYLTCSSLLISDRSPRENHIGPVAPVVNLVAAFVYY